MGQADILTGIIGGLVAGSLVVVLPPLIVLVIVAGLFGLAALTRFERMEDIGTMFLILTAATMPMNRLAVAAVPVSDLLMTFALGVFLLIRLTHPDRDAGGALPYRRIFAALGVLAAGGLLGTLFEAPGALIYQAVGELPRDVTGFGANLGQLNKFVLGSFMPMALWALARPSRALMRKILGAFVVGCCTSVLLGVLLSSTRVSNGRMAGYTVHPGQFGSLSIMGSGVALALILSKRPFPVWGFVALPMLAYGVFGSGSRAGLGGLVVLYLIIGPATRSKAMLGTMMVGVACVLLVFATGAVKPEGENALGRTLGGASSATGSSEIREGLGKNVLARWEQRPITGNGYNMMKPSHNVYLGLLSSAGVLGILGMALLLSTVFRRAWRRRNDMMVLGVGAGYAAYLCAAYFDNIFWWRWLWFYVGMVVAVSATSPGPGEVGYVDPALLEQDEPTSGPALAGG